MSPSSELILTKTQWLALLENYLAFNESKFKFGLKNTTEVFSIVNITKTAIRSTDCALPELAGFLTLLRLCLLKLSESFLKKSE